jgi:hypothetical protein
VTARVGQVAVLNQVQPIGLRVRERPEQNAVDDAEDGRVRADAERQRDERHERDTGVRRSRRTL